MAEVRKGIVQVYTGDGKGKTTAALGLALRAVGHGLKAYMIQFMKGDIEYGELRSARRLHPDFQIEQFGRPDFVDKRKPSSTDVELATKALKKACEVVKSGKWDLVILDEVNIALDYELISVEDVLDLIRTRPLNVELILTGRNAPDEVIAVADLVSEVREIKHPYSTDLKARVGIDY